MIICHHNLQTGGGKHGVLDTAALMDTLRSRKQVKAYLFGHQHRWETAQDASGIHLVNLPAVAYVFNKEQPSGWLRAHTEPNRLRLELRALDRSHKAHGQVVALDYR
ncbi:MAG: Icc protein [Rhodothermales bacterium]